MKPKRLRKDLKNRYDFERFLMFVCEPEWKSNVKDM